ncbi:MAG TPA: polyprenyl synthetase family protein [Polyangiaceae bacterium]|nr:polyprenyl synthetase family protein [Polyangiaceae bacterium]
MANPIQIEPEDTDSSGSVSIRSLGRAEDWPGPGPIDLSVHDAPHASSTLEWWYVNTHLELESGQKVAVFAAFFRQLAEEGDGDRARTYTHSVAWGISLIDERRFISKVAVDPLACQVGLDNLDAGVKNDDERVERAYREVLRKGKIPGPTRMFHTAPGVAERGLALDYDGDRFEKRSDNRYRLVLNDTQSDVACELELELQKPPTRYGEDGVVHGVSGETMFYYFVPRAEVTGSVRVGAKHERVASGSGWYDHEFGFNDHRPGSQRPESERPESGVVALSADIGPDNDTIPAQRGETCWRWLSLQLDDGSDLSVFFITRRATGEVLDNWTMLVDPRGRSSVYRDAKLETREKWRSTRTFIEYPVGMRVQVPSASLDLNVLATFGDQEVITVISEPAFWEGSVQVSGVRHGQPIAGRGWLECKGFGHADLDEFYSAVGREVRARLSQTLPLEPSLAATAQMMVRGGGSQPVTSNPDLDPDRLARCLVQPIREIADRGGKGWRSYAALACIDVVGGDSRRFLHWLVMPEIVHVGSLIVDDVEDESSVRRGGPCAHVLHGLPRAINSGTAAYFLAEPPIDKDDLPADRKLRIYRLYFDALRAGHAGQALDLDDVSELADHAAFTGETRELERHVMAVHKLKTAVPAGMFARAGALLGGGSDLEVETLGAFFEAVGLAFQIIDDVLNIRGFERNLKQRGEDITQGKLTLPVVKALAQLPTDQRSWLWRTLASRPSNPAVVDDVIRLLETCGALDQCTAQARELVEAAWAQLDPVLEDSQYKLMFRAFSWYVLERHY